jgi:hypothetical protein
MPTNCIEQHNLKPCPSEKKEKTWRLPGDDSMLAGIKIAILLGRGVLCGEPARISQKTPLQ